MNNSEKFPIRNTHYIIQNSVENYRQRSHYFLRTNEQIYTYKYNWDGDFFVVTRQNIITAYDAEFSATTMFL